MWMKPDKYNNTFDQWLGKTSALLKAQQKKKHSCPKCTKSALLSDSQVYLSKKNDWKNIKEVLIKMSQLKYISMFMFHKNYC